MLVATQFIKSLTSKYGKHPSYSGGGTWYPKACSTLGLKHYLHSSYEKNVFERVNHYFKDRIEAFDDYYPYVKKDCDLVHIYN